METSSNIDFDAAIERQVSPSIRAYDGSACSSQRVPNADRRRLSSHLRPHHGARREPLLRSQNVLECRNCPISKSAQLSALMAVRRVHEVERVWFRLQVM